MEPLIDDLVRCFERGAMTRRQLIAGLSALVAATGTPPETSAQAPGLRGTGIDHVSILVTDLQRSAAFYQSLFGMTPLSEDKPNQILRLGMKRTIVSLRHEGPSGVVDHFAITVENFNREAVTAQLKQHGLTPQENVQFGFHIKDPDGVVVQIV
jgi:catechol 2,3-dioxygenase-like lactoylglutathione lyase family enzyme